MNIQNNIENKKIIQNKILEYIEDVNNDNNNGSFDKLKQIFDDQKISENVEEFEEFLRLIANISCNYQRNPEFFNKIEAIILLFKKDIRDHFSNAYIYKIFEKNQRIILFLINENIMVLDYSIISEMTKIDIKYFSPEIKLFVENDYLKRSYSNELIQAINSPISDDFYNNRLIGENEALICKFIRDGNVVEFIKYVNQANLPLNMKIKQSFFETNLYLKENSPNLIEYSAFFGSIQIFQFLRLNKVELTEYIWPCAIHGGNADIIYILEENKIRSKFIYEYSFEESIKCYKNDIAYYIQDKFLKSEYEYKNCFFEYMNYDFYPKNINDDSFFHLCYYEHYSLARLYLKSINFDPNFLFDINDYEMKRLIARGKKADTYVYANKATSKLYVIKIFHEKFFPYFKLNPSIMKEYPAILNIKGFTVANHKSMILTDYLNICETSKIILSECLSPTECYIAILGLAIGLKYLHENGIIHLSLNLDNILLDKSRNPIISDIVSPFPKYCMETHVINEYESPEIIENINLEDSLIQASNIYSFSILAFELMTSFKVNYHQNFNFHKKISRFIENKFISNFLKKCSDNDPKKRLSIDEIINSITSKEFFSYFDDFDNNKVINYLDIYGDKFNYLKNKFK